MKNGRNTLVGEVEIPSETQEFTLEKAAEILISDEEYLLFMASRGEFSIHGKSGKKNGFPPQPAEVFRRKS